MNKNNKINQLIKFIVIIISTSFSTYSQETTDKDFVFDICEKVQNPESQVDNLDSESLASLPIGIVKIIAGTKYIIAIDSAEFTPEGAYFNAYMAVQLPGADEKIAFAAKHIKFNPKGVMGGDQARLALVSEHNIKLGPKNSLYLPSDGSNYIDWDCNGFKAVNLHGAFILDPEKLIPVNQADLTVKAEFEMRIVDLNNILASVNVNPFSVKGLDDFEFTVTEAYVDMSDYSNPQSINFPPNYENYDPSVGNLWRGFYLKNLEVKLPKELNKKGKKDMTIFAENMIIDEAGVSGKFGGENFFSTREGDADGWGLSIDLIAVDLVASQLTGGEIKGEISVPALDNQNLNYNAAVSINPTTTKTNYTFAVDINKDIVRPMPALNAQLTINASSTLSMTLDTEGHFKPKLKLNGALTVAQSKVKLSKLSFEKITFVTEAPYLTDGKFSLTSTIGTTGTEPNSDNNLSKFKLSLNLLEFHTNQGNLSLRADIGLNLGKEGDPNGIAVKSDFLLKFKIENQDGKKKWKPDGLVVNTIQLSLHTTAFHFDGLINFRNDHPVFGDGFSGVLSLSIPSVLEPGVTLACAFGNVDGYKYWMVDATVPVNIPISAVTLTSLSGGLAYHMSPEKSAAEMISAASDGGVVATPTPSQNYIPNQNMGVIFKAGVGFRATAGEQTLNGDVLFSIAFNSNGGLDNVKLFGEAYMMCKIKERKTAENFMKGSILVVYDNQQKILDVNASLTAKFGGAISGSIWTKLYLSPDLWYFWLGTPTNPGTINVYDLVTAEAYFMLGQQLQPIPQPPLQITSAFGTLTNQIDTESIANGSGIALGLRFNMGFVSGYDLTSNINIYGSGNVGGGFDMTLMKYGASAHCSGSSEPFGLNQWYLQGQVYAYCGLNFGVRRKGKEFNILNVNSAMLLVGKLPKPTFVYGAVALHAEFLGGLIKFDIQGDIKLGTDCTIVN